MTPDEMREREDTREVHTERTGMDEKFKAVLVILALLVVGEIYSLSRMRTLRNDFRGQETQTRQQLTNWFNQQVTAKLGAFEQSNATQLEALKIELDESSRHLGAQRVELRRARQMVTKLQDAHTQQLNELKQEIALKADQQQLGALTDDVSATKSDLGVTKQNVSSLADSLGMLRGNTRI